MQAVVEQFEAAVHMANFEAASSMAYTTEDEAIHLMLKQTTYENTLPEPWAREFNMKAAIGGDGKSWSTGYWGLG